ncbi:uncharacterized protein LOC126372401 [Pectinophora gossypiella]|uniref:uncharacterized protein LOC126372401 n=1 Tax=Pectinophora gossypiella TaxID=13191 RepID=UPI00214E2935|nr:uncharacterized protein LOC126372401 [Pectinophora gossypiella]
MHAYLAIAFALVAPALADPLPRDRLGYEREIDATNLNQLHSRKLEDFVLSDEFLASQKNRAKLITRLRPDEALAADNVILESNVVRIVRPAKRRVEPEAGEELVRRRRGYNLEHVNVPARYPYLPVPSYYRFRRWG